MVYKKSQERERDKKVETIINEMQKRFQEEGGENGYFTKLWKKLGYNPTTNIKSFKFKREVLNAYSQELPTQIRFIIEGGITSYIRDKEGIWSLKFSENGEFVEKVEGDNQKAEGRKIFNEKLSKECKTNDLKVLV